jgi:hypothetical protein
MEIKENELPILLGMPVSKAGQLKARITKYVPPFGAEQKECSLCSQKVWLGEKQIEFGRAHPEAAVLCPLCSLVMTAGEVARVGGLGGTSAEMEWNHGNGDS